MYARQRGQNKNSGITDEKEAELLVIERTWRTDEKHAELLLVMERIRQTDEKQAELLLVRDMTW